MSVNIQDNFKRVVEHVFNNWTALQLAVENEMGGPTSHQTAIEVMNWVGDYCVAQNDLHTSELTEVLEDIMDEEFSTICEDDSPKEIAHILLKFLTYLKEGNLQQFEADFINLPVCKGWLSKGREQTSKIQRNPVSEPEIQSQTEQQMDVDSEWTVVQRKKK